MLLKQHPDPKAAMDNLASGDKADFIGLELESSANGEPRHTTAAVAIKSKAEIHPRPEEKIPQNAGGSRRQSSEELSEASTSQATLDQSTSSVAREADDVIKKFDLDLETVSDFERLEKAVNDEEGEEVSKEGMKTTQSSVSTSQSASSTLRKKSSKVMFCICWSFKELWIEKYISSF